MNNIFIYEYSLGGFIGFLKKNKIFCITIILIILYIYGIKIFNPTPEIDSVTYMQGSKYLNWREIGRYGLIIFQSLWQIKIYNPVFGSFFSVLFLILAVFHWCYLFYIFSEKKYSQLLLISSGLLIASSSVWVEMFYFTCMASECAFIIFLCPYVIWLAIAGALHNNIINIIISILLLCFGTSVYQSFYIMFCTGTIGCILLLTETSSINNRQYITFIIKGLILAIIAIALYFIFDILFVKIIFKTSKSNYLTQNIAGVNRKSILRMSLSILAYFFGNTPIFDNNIQANAKSGSEAVKSFHDYYWQISNILYLPLIITYIISLFKKHTISVLKIVMGFLVLLIIVSLNIIALGRVAIRSLWAFPIGLSFIILYTSRCFSKRITYIFAGLFILVSFQQAQKSALLFFTDYVRYQQDVVLSNILAQKIRNIDTHNKLPILIIGAYKPYLGKNFKRGEVIGHSVFGFNNSKNKNDASGYGCAFLNAHGIGCKEVLSTDHFIDEARKIAESMPYYPSYGYIKKTEHCIIIKLSESTFKSE